MLYIGNEKLKPKVNNNNATFKVTDLYDAEIEYLESTGTQYININIIPTNLTKFIIDLLFTSLTSTDTTNGLNSGVMGGTSVDSGGRFHIGIYQNMFHFGFGTLWINATNANLNRHVFKLLAGYAYIDENVYSINNSSLTTNNSIYIFTRNHGSSLTTPEKTKVFGIQIFENNILVRDLIPVRIAQLGYMYDKVSKRIFLNKGTGNFILGPDKYDAEIEYLESTGTQYIDTLFYPRTTLTDIKVENKFNKSVQSGDHCVLGARTGTSGLQGFKLPNFYNNTLEYQGLIPASVSGNITTFNIDTDYTSMVEIKQGSQKVYVDGVLKIEQSNSGNCDGGGNLYLFAMHQNGVKWFFNGKIYYCKIWQDDVLVRNFIPVRVGTTGYMYDKISGQYFGNAGTGDFVLGPDKLEE